MSQIRVIQLYRYVLQYWGLRVDPLPIQSPIIREIIIWILRIINWVGVICFVYFQATYIIQFNDSISGDQEFEFYIFIIATLAGVFKYIMIMKNQHHLRELIYTIDENINEKIQQPTRKSMYEETHKLVQKMLKTCIFILHGIPNIGVFVPPIVYIIIDVILGRYVAENRIFPLHVYLPYNHFISPNYEITYLLSIICLATTNLHFGGTSTLLCVISIHVAAIIKDLRFTIKELDDPITFETTSLRDDNTTVDSVRLKRLIICILQHRKTLRIIEMYQSVSSGLIFLQYFFSMITTVLIIFKITSVSDGASIALLYMQYLCTMLFDLLTVTYSGQIIYNEMQSVVSQLYDIKWYNYDKNAKYCFRMMLFRAQKSSYLTGWKMIRSNMESYKTSLSSIASLYALLKSVKDPSKIN